MDNRWQEIRGIQKEYTNFYRVLGAVVMLTIGIAIGVVIFYDADPLGFADKLSYSSNLFTEFISIFIISVILDSLNEQRAMEQSERELKEHLLHKLGSRINSRALAALDDLERYGWVYGDDSILNGANLQFANLSETRLNYINFSGSDLRYANFENTVFFKTPMKNCNLDNANLKGSHFFEVSLNGCSLRNANLRNVNIIRNVSLINVDLSGAYLEGAKIDTQLITHVGHGRWPATIMPNGEPYTRDMDVTMFTDPNHPNFWSPPEKPT